MSGDEGTSAGLTLRAVELGESESLGGDVRLEVAERTTVLVGKNGAGKSALLERLAEAFGVASKRSSRVSGDPRWFACDFHSDAPRDLRYRYDWKLDESEGFAGELFEVCEELHPQPQLLWDMAAGGLISTDDRHLHVAFSRQTNTIARELASWAASVHRVAATFVGSRERDPVLVAKGRVWHQAPLAALTARLYDWKHHAAETFEELCDVARRIHLFDEIRCIDTGDHHAYFFVEIDGVNLGYLSDGTLRALEILVELILPTKLLMIDEPESAVHPGLLERLLHEIDAYADDRQIIIATQSPQVVSWADPAGIRLVERKDGLTRVHGLDAATLARLDTYLHEGDTLGDFIYGGGIDGIAG